MSNIPKIENLSKKTRIVQPQVNNSGDEFLLFSFDKFETNEFFNLDKTCESWSIALFNFLRDISKIKKQELMSGKFPNYRIHNHQNCHPPTPVPNDVSLKDFYQIRISKSKGGIHGILVLNVFYIVWLDPLHNLYPSSKHGGLKEIQPWSNCCCEEKNQCIYSLQQEKDELSFRVRELEDQIDAYLNS